MEMEMVQTSRTETNAFRILFALFLMSLIAACILTYDYVNTRRTTENAAKTKATEQTQNAATQINDLVKKIEPVVTQLANDLTAGTVTQANLEQALRERGNDLLGLGVMYVPTEQQKKYAPYYTTKNGAREMVQLGDTVDYTEKSYTRYSIPFTKGALFLDPFTDPINNARIIEFGTPFYSPINKSQIMGIVFGNIALQKIEDLLNKLELGSQGYAFIIADDGTFVYHPDQTLVTMKIQFFDVAKKLNESLYQKLIASTAKAGTTRVFHEYNNNLTDQLSWLIGEPIPAPRWNIVSVLVKDEIKLYTITSKRRVIQFTLLYALAFISLLCMLFNVHKGSRAGMWGTVTIATFVLAFLIGGSWYIAVFTAFYETEADTMEVVHDRLALKKYLSGFIEKYKNQQASSQQQAAAMTAKIQQPQDEQKDDSAKKKIEEDKKTENINPMDHKVYKEMQSSTGEITTHIDAGCWNPDFCDERSPELNAALAAAAAAAEAERKAPHQGCGFGSCNATATQATPSAATSMIAAPSASQATTPPASPGEIKRDTAPAPIQEKTTATPPAVTTTPITTPAAAATSSAALPSIPGMPDLAELAKLSPEQQAAMLAQLPPELQSIILAKKAELVAAAQKKIANSIIPIPTGIQIRTLSFEKNNNAISISGTIWQRYPKALPEQFIGEPAFPQATSSSLSVLYKFQEPASTVIGWKFNATLAQSFDYAKYPFDEKKIRIHIAQKDKTSMFLLIPDFQSYTITTGTSLPGISKQLSLPDWRLQRSFFGYQTPKSFSNFGLYQITSIGSLKDESKEFLPQLYFCIDASRNALSSLLLNLFPMVLILMILFLILLMTSLGKIDARNIIATCSGLFFSVLISQTQFKSSLPTQEFVFFENLYFIMYLGILIVAVRCFIYAIDVEVPFFPNKHFYVTELLFWPVALMLMLLVSLYNFY